MAFQSVANMSVLRFSVSLTKKENRETRPNVVGHHPDEVLITINTCYTSPVDLVNTLLAPKNSSSKHFTDEDHRKIV